jgi:L-arabinose isomerase
VREMDTVPPHQIAEHARQLAATFELPPEFPRQDSDSIAAVMGALNRLIDLYNLCGLPNHFDGTPAGREAEVLAAFNPALSILNTHGIACPVEGDIKTALAMLILKGLGGSATLAELYSMDFNEDVCIIGHSGAGDAAISDRKPTLAVSEVFHGKSGKGYVTQFYPKTGPVTLCSLTQDAAGEYRLIAAEGECVPGPQLNLGDTNCRVRFPCGLREFVNRWSILGPTHHGVLGLGHHVEALRKMAILLDVPLEIVCS